MVNEFILDWSTVIYLLVPCVYLFILKILDLKQKHRPAASDEEYITVMARMAECSEYDIFFLAAESWSFPRDRVEGDFRDYLNHGQLPFYVKDYVRKVREL